MIHDTICVCVFLFGVSVCASLCTTYLPSEFLFYFVLPGIGFHRRVGARALRTKKKKKTKTNYGFFFFF